MNVIRCDVITYSVIIHGCIGVNVGMVLYNVITCRGIIFKEARVCVVTCLEQDVSITNKFIQVMFARVCLRPAEVVVC